MHKVAAVSVFLCVVLGCLGAAPAAVPESQQEGQSPAQFTFALEPSVTVPLGSSNSDFALGGAGTIRGELVFPSLPFLFFTAGIGYAYSPLQYVRSVSTVAATLGVGLRTELTPWLAARAYVEGGAYDSFLNDPVDIAPGVYPLASAGAGLSFDFSPTISLLLDGRYENRVGLYQGIGAGLGLAVHLGGKHAPSVFVRDERFADIFSVFYKYYDDHTLGEAVLENRESAPITDVRVRLQIKEYMDSPKDCVVAPTVKPGESQKISLYGLFKSSVLDVTEATKVPVEITVDYVFKGEKYSVTRVQTLRVLDRNAMTWDDDRRVAAFITAKEPAVLDFSKNVLATVGSRLPPAIDRNLLMGMAIHDALVLKGVAYSPDPARPYSETSKDKSTVDFLQFPRQTLDYRAGDCDDLTILSCALMESIDVQTAFITVPGHIFMALALRMGEEDARKTLLDPDSAIYRDGKVWIPVEITETQGDFLDAWLLGAKEWKENAGKGTANFYTTADSWAAYEPVGLPGSSSSGAPPAEASLTDRFQKDLSRYVDHEIAPRVTVLQAEIKSSGGSSRSVNKLGVLFARYGQGDKAEQQFLSILGKEEFPPALTNLGNLALMKGDAARAITYYGRAYRKDAGNPSALVGLAKAYSLRGDSVQASSWYQKLQAVAPDLAEKYAYLMETGISGTRAGQAGALAGGVEWAEE
jgi:Tetratricopeptide repeat